MIKQLLLLFFFFIPVLAKAQADTVAAKISKIPNKHVDALAKFPQGDFKNYISNNLQSNHTTEYSVKGTIILLMSIDADGSISHVSILKSLSPQFDPEVVRVIYASPKWQPAILDGKKTNMDMVLNIDIAIKGYKKTPIPASIKPALANISKPIFAKVEPIAKIPAQKSMPPVTKKTAPAVAAKTVLPPVKKPAPVTAKKVEPPPVKKPVPVAPKKVELPAAKKPAPVIAKKVDVIAAKKPAPVKPKKIEIPVATKPIPVIAKKVEPPPIKKPAPVVAKKMETPIAKKPTPVIAKKAEKPIVKKTTASLKKEPETAKKIDLPPAVKKPKRVLVRQDLFNPTSNNAEFPNGGLPAFFKYLGANIQYPEASKKANIEGKVILSFVIEDDGTLDDIEIISSPAEDLSQEAIRVLLASPKWKPATQNKIKVATSYQIPIKFTLTK